MASKKRKLSDTASPSSPASKRSKATPTTTASRSTLFIRNLPPTATTDALLTHFSATLPVRHATAVLDASGACKGYGFVTFADAADAEQARQQWDGAVVLGRKVRVEVAEPRHREEGGAAESKKKEEGDGTLEQREKPRTKLIVRNLPWSFAKEPSRLERVFQRFGKVLWVNVPQNRGKAKGFGFVVLRGRKNAEMAVEGANGMVLDGRKVAVDWAVEKEVWEGKKGEEESGEDDEGSFGSGAEDQETENGVEQLSDEEWEDESDERMGEEDEHEGEEEDSTDENHEQRSQDLSTTLFVRNLPFTCSDEELSAHFAQFGKIRYARVVMDHDTERSKGTGFVCFFNPDDAHKCLRNAPRSTQPPQSNSSSAPSHSILQNEEQDPTGQYTIEGRILQIAKAVDRNEATRLTTEGVQRRDATDRDKRRLFLLSEGTVTPSSPLYQLLAPSELSIRDASYKQRKSLIQSNPSLHLSLTRLSVRNIPRSVTSKDLKALAREAVVGFASDVKEGKRAKLSKEELARGGENMAASEHERKKRGVGVVKQAKVVFESRDGSKVAENAEAGRSRGYGFIEYHSHRSALMGLRWLNGHEVGYRVMETEKKGKKSTKEEAQEKKKRLIVEFAIENAQVVNRRREREKKMREKPQNSDKLSEPKTVRRGRSLFTVDESVNGGKSNKKEVDPEQTETKATKEEKLAKRQMIIAKKRAQRRGRKKAMRAS